MELILSEEQLKDEIGFLKRALRTKRRLASLRADQDPQSSPAKAPAPYEHGSTKISLLMEWVRAVCAFYSLRVSLKMHFLFPFDLLFICYFIAASGAMSPVQGSYENTF